MTMRAGLGMRTSLADAPGLSIHGRGRRHRLGLLAGLAEATPAVPGQAKPVTNCRLLQRWRGRQAKNRDHRGDQ
jgi:hypothetical protein